MGSNMFKPWSWNLACFNRSFQKIFLIRLLCLRFSARPSAAAAWPLGRWDTARPRERVQHSARWVQVDPKLWWHQIWPETLSSFSSISQSTSFRMDLFFNIFSKRHCKFTKSSVPNHPSELTDFGIHDSMKLKPRRLKDRTGPFRPAEFLGSPNEGLCTEYLLDAFLDGSPRSSWPHRVSMGDAVVKLHTNWCVYINHQNHHDMHHIYMCVCVVVTCVYNCTIFTRVFMYMVLPNDYLCSGCFQVWCWW